jgi:hypothetical protein
MPALSAVLGSGGQSGGIVGYPLERVYEEVAFLGYHLHWDCEALLGMPHGERRRWCEQVSKINQTINEGGPR